MSQSPDEKSHTAGSPRIPVEHVRRDEVAVLRDATRVFELTASANEALAQEYRQMTRSRVYPLVVVVMKTANGIEVILRALLKKRPLSVASAPEPDHIETWEDAFAVPETGATAGESSAPVPTVPDQPTTPPKATKIGYLLLLVRKFLSQLSYALRVLFRGYAKAGHHERASLTPYEHWVQRFMTFGPDADALLRRRLTLMTYQPTLSIVMATYNTDHSFLVEAIESVRAQVYGNFELLIADDCSPDAGVRDIVRDYAARDPRIRLFERSENGGISRATNTALAEARGEWVVFMDHDDTLVPHALFHVVLALNDTPHANLLYSDEDKIDESNTPFMPYFKPDFDPLLLLGQNYVCHLTTVRRSLVEQVGRLRPEFDGSQDWDLVLRVSEVVDRSTIVHIPHVLYHWRSHRDSTSQSSAAKPWALAAGRRAVADALERRGVKASVNEVGGTGFALVAFDLPETPPLVSIMIPTRDGIYLATAVTSVLEMTTYPHFEVVVIDNGSVKPDTAAFLASLDDRVRVVRDDSPFNYSALHNRAVPSCRGDVLVLLNDDTEIIDGEWLSALVGLLLQPGVGAVGAKLLYPDRRVQHAGVILGPYGLAGHVNRLMPSNDFGYFGRAALPCEYQAVTAACVAVRRSIWDEVGGLDETFAVGFNDIDFCLRVRAAGHQVAYTPLAQLIHYESVSRGVDHIGPKFERFTREIAMMRDRWGLEIFRDPYYNPNLAFGHAMFTEAFPPRVSPWYTGIE